jgi:hypothetical protein
MVYKILGECVLKKSNVCQQFLSIFLALGVAPLLSSCDESAEPKKEGPKEAGEKEEAAEREESVKAIQEAIAKKEEEDKKESEEREERREMQENFRQEGSMRASSGLKKR